MKKCLSIMILVLVMMLVSIPCFAEITYNEDSFDDTVNFSSKREIGDFRMFNLETVKSADKSVTKFFMVAIIKTEWYFLSGPLEMRIGNKIYELEQLGHLEKVTPSGSLASIGSYYINEPMEDRIMLADSIVIRVPYSNQVSTVLAIPPSVLKEWQEVLKVGPQRK